MDKQQELMEKIKKIKHDFSKLIPTTIELMFDACMGILYEEFTAKMNELDARQKASGVQSIKLGLLRAQAEGDLNRNKALVLHLRERVTSIYSEAKSESEKNKESGSKGCRQPDGPGAAPTGGEGGSGGGQQSPPGSGV
jgi:hypothetical protein